MASVKRILYIDGDNEARLMMRDLVAPNELHAVATEEEGRALVHRQSYDLYIVAGGAPAGSGIGMCEWLQRIDGRTPIVFCSSNGTARYQESAIAAGAVRYLVKPLDPKLLRSTLSLLLKLTELESARAMALERQAIHDELVERSRGARESSTAARDRAQQAIDCMLRVKAYRAFRNGGGNRANFERMWPTAMEQTGKEQP